MKEVKSVLLSCFDKSKLLPLAQYLHEQKIKIYSTGGTADFLKSNSIESILIEDLTHYPSILGGRVKTLHPLVFGGILARTENENDQTDIEKFSIPKIDLVVVDLYPFSEAVKNKKSEEECIEKIDIGGVSLIRGAAKNFSDCAVLCDTKQYDEFLKYLKIQKNCISLVQRKHLASFAFNQVAIYDAQIANYFDERAILIPAGVESYIPRYGENPHQAATFWGDISKLFTQLSGKAISYNNLLDIHVAFQILYDLKNENLHFWGIIKHNNICGAALKNNSLEAWQSALQGDAESAFGGILFSNKNLDAPTAQQIAEIFFEIILVPDVDVEALHILSQKKNRIILKYSEIPHQQKNIQTILNGVLSQTTDEGNFKSWKEVGGRRATSSEKNDFIFANLLCKHLKSNAIAIVKHQTLIGKGAGQTSRIDALKQAIQKAEQFSHSLQHSVVASDAFFPFDDCVKLAHKNGIIGFIQPGGSIRDEDSILYCQKHQLVMIMTEQRHFKH